MVLLTFFVINSEFRCEMPVDKIELSDMGSSKFKMNTSARKGKSLAWSRPREKRAVNRTGPSTALIFRTKIVREEAVDTRMTYHEV